MRTATDVMTPNPKMVGSGDCLKDVVALFLDQGITSSPVINPLGEILGILSELSLVKAYMLHKTKLDKSDRVGHHMSLLIPPTFVNTTSTMGEIVKEMILSPTHRLLVRDSKNRTVGIISPKDLMRAMRGEANPSPNIRQKLEETEQQLRHSLKQMKSLEKQLEVYHQAFHEVPYMMHAVDADGKILMANKREHEMLGYKDGELIGKSIFDLYAPSMHDEARRGLKRIIETGHHYITYTTLLRKDGGSVRCDIASSSLQSEKGEFVSTISVLRPVDADELLRILNGIIDDEDGPLTKYANQK